MKKGFSPSADFCSEEPQAVSITAKPSTVTLNSVVGDSAAIPLTASPADYQISDVNIRLAGSRGEAIAKDLLAKTQHLLCQCAIRGGAGAVLIILEWLRYRQNGEFAIGFKDNTVQTTAKYPTSVGLNVFYEGNNTNSPNAAVTLKLTAR